MTVEENQVEATSEEVGDVFKPGPSAKDITPKQDGGVLKEVITEGVGDLMPSSGCKVEVHYDGKLLDGTPFDSSRGRSPFSFDLGKGSVIKAWDIGVATMKKGETCRLFCREDYAYGKNGSPPKIPPDATLVFEIEMLDWQAEDLSGKKDKSLLRFRITSGDQEGGSPKEGSTVVAHLIGEHDGKVFEDREAEWCLGEGSEEGVAPGVEKALEKFTLNEKSRLELKPQYGFGSAGNPRLNVPPNATVSYTVTLKSFTKVKDSWMLESQERIEQGLLYKEKGTKYFKAEKYSLAQRMYKKMLDFLEQGTGFEEELEKERKTLLLVSHLNLAMCYLKLNNFTLARNQCDKALEQDPKNIKALFRRGQALLGLNEPDLAKVDFECVLVEDSTNKAAAQQIQTCVKKIREVRGREKQIYANMFEKYNQKKEVNS